MDWLNLRTKDPQEALRFLTFVCFAEDLQQEPL